MFRFLDSTLYPSDRELGPIYLETPPYIVPSPLPATSMGSTSLIQEAFILSHLARSH